MPSRLAATGIEPACLSGQHGAAFFHQGFALANHLQGKGILELNMTCAPLKPNLPGLASARQLEAAVKNNRQTRELALAEVEDIYLQTAGLFTEVTNLESEAAPPLVHFRDDRNSQGVRRHSQRAGNACSSMTQAHHGGGMRPKHPGPLRVRHHTHALAQPAPRWNTNPGP